MMRNYPWIFVAGGLLALAVASGACSSNDTKNDSAAGGGGSGAGVGGNDTNATGTTTTTTTATATTTTTGVGATTGAGGGGNCTGTGWFTTGCDACMTTVCCQEINDCLADAACPSCAESSSDEATCFANPVFVALADCFQNSCTMACDAKSTCNPVTNEGCDTAAGEACDLGSNGAFSCFGPPNDTPLCGTCSNQKGPFCAPGMHCNGGMNGAECTKYCCDDGDCGTGKCDKSGSTAGVGWCVGANMEAASCDAPDVPPSNGSCYMP